MHIISDHIVSLIQKLVQYMHKSPNQTSIQTRGQAPQPLQCNSSSNTIRNTFCEKKDFLLPVIPASPPAQLLIPHIGAATLSR